MSVGSAKRPVRGLEAYEYMLDTPRAMIDKLARDLDRLRAEHAKSADYAFGFAVMAWHLTDWVWRFDEILRPGITVRFGCDNLLAFQAKIRLDSPSLGLCADVANGSKHLVAGSCERREIAPSVSKNANEQVSLGDGLIKSGGLALPKTILVITLPGGGFDRAEEVFESALQFWIDFSVSHGLVSAKLGSCHRGCRTNLIASSD